MTEPLTRGDISLTITATGNLEPTTAVTLGGELSGTTLEFNVDFNDRVTTGTPLARLDTSKRIIQVPFNFNLQINLIAFVFAAAVGVLFGYTPARRAARLKPIDAPRHE